MSRQYTKDAKKKQAEYQAAYRARLREKGMKSVTLFVPVDKQLFDVSHQEEDQRILEMRKLIDVFRDCNKGTISLAKQKDLVLLVQHLEEMLG